MAKASNRNKKQDVTADDAFVEAAQQSIAWVDQHKNTVLASMVGVAIMVSAGFGGSVYLDDRNTEASGMLYEAVEGIRGQEDAGDEVIDRFNALNRRFEGSALSTMGNLYAAGLEVQTEKFDSATQRLRKLLEGVDSHDTLYFLGVEKLANIYADRGKLDDALSTWGRLNSNEVTFYRDRALYQMARLSNMKGDGARAQDYLNELTKLFPDTTIKPEAEILSGLLKAQK